MNATDRYRKQRLVGQFGADGQAALGAAHAVIVGCGALGTAQAATLVRAGIGRLTLIDRDIVEEENLHRQFLFDERDAAEARPKALAAAERMKEANSSVAVTPRVADLTPATCRDLLGQADLVIDATDNFETRYLVNDYCVQNGIPWIYGGVSGTEGMMLAVRPGRTACLRCLQPEPPPAGSVATCETAGILAPIVSVIAAIQSLEAMKILGGKQEELLDGLVSVDLWTGRLDRLAVRRRPDCPCCGHGQFAWLDGTAASAAVRLCGQNSVHINPAPGARPPDLAALAARLAPGGQVNSDPWALHFRNPETELIVFNDGRILVRGTAEPERARALVARWLGM